MTERLRRLDDEVLGRPVPDDRPRLRRVLRPLPAVWSMTGRLLYGVILLGMVAVLRWAPETVGALALAPMLAALFLVSTADERKRARQFYEDRDK